MNDNLSSLLAPKSIAVIGASSDFGRIGGMLIKYLLKFGYKGKIYPVNPKYKDIAGIRCYKNVSDLPGETDLALIAVSEKITVKTLSDCGDQGINNAIIYSAGFAETGVKGKRRQDELRQIVEKKKLNLCGPNCIGIINFIDNIAMSFTGFLESDRLIPGSVGFVSQSGALGGSIVNRAQDRNIGFSYFISTGNEAGLDATDFIEFLVDDPNTRVIISYLEGIRDSEKFKRAAAKAFDLEKPVIVLKVGETLTGGKVAASHTGSITGSDTAYSAVFRKYGVIRVENYDDLIETALLFSKYRPSLGKRVGILTGTGGGAIILADKITKNGLEIAELSEVTKDRLSKKLVSFTSVANPLDLTGQLYSDPEMFKDVINIFALDKNIDIVLVVISMVPGERAKKRAEFIIEAAKTVNKPFVSWWAAGNLSEPAFELLDQSKVALFKSPDRCIAAIRSLSTYAQHRVKFIAGEKESEPLNLEIDQDRAKAILKSGDKEISEHEAKQVLSCYQVPVTQEAVASSPEQAVEIAETIGYPVALKISSGQIPHKTDAGGIKLNLCSRVEVVRAYHEILASITKYDAQVRIDGVLVQEMVNEGIEIMIGVSKDPQLGAMLVFGIGGIFVEVLKDVSIRPLPITRLDAEEMVWEIRGHEILKGVRGRGAADVKGIIDTLLKVSAFCTDLGSLVAEVDLNPVVVFETGMGVKVIDALIIKENELIN